MKLKPKWAVDRVNEAIRHWALELANRPMLKDLLDKPKEPKKLGHE